jgi:DNA-binding PadR family transcriptional regulator
MASEMTSTAYAVLGFLALRPWTTYELAQNMRRNFHFFFRRAESALYEEPKRLVREGYAIATQDHVGARARTTYAITPKGRRALRKWLATPCPEPSLDAEVLVRLFFARASDPEQVASWITRTRAVADDVQRIGDIVAREFLEGTAPHQAQPHLNAMVFDFLWTWADQMRAWADRWEPEIREWRDTRISNAKARKAARVFEERIRN